MTCAECQELLLDLVYDELAPARAAEVRAHLAGCDSCRTEYEKLAGTRAMVSPLALAAIEEPSAGFDAKLLEAARVAAAAPRDNVVKLAGRPRKVSWMRRAVFAGSVAAAAALAVVVSKQKQEAEVTALASAEERSSAALESASQAKAMQQAATRQEAAAKQEAEATKEAAPKQEAATGQPASAKSAPPLDESKTTALDKEPQAAPRGAPKSARAGNELMPPPAPVVVLQAPATPAPGSAGAAREGAHLSKKAKAASRPSDDADGAPETSGAVSKDRMALVPYGRDSRNFDSVMTTVPADKNDSLAALGLSGGEVGSSGGGGLLGALGAEANGGVGQPQLKAKGAKKESANGFAPPPPPVACRGTEQEVGTRPAESPSSAADQPSASPAPTDAPAAPPARALALAKPAAPSAAPPQPSFIPQSATSAGPVARAAAAPAKRSLADVESSAQSARASGALEEAGSLYRTAAHARMSSGETEAAARDLVSAVGCYVDAGLGANARAARAELAALSPAQVPALQAADQLLSNLQQNQIRAAPSAPASPMDARPDAAPPMPASEPP